MWQQFADLLVNFINCFYEECLKRTYREPDSSLLYVGHVHTMGDVVAQVQHHSYVAIGEMPPAVTEGGFSLTAGMPPPRGMVAGSTAAFFCQPNCA